MDNSGRGRKRFKNAPQPHPGVELAKKPGKLTRQEVTCPICWSILIQPTTLPCKHSFCTECLRTHVDQTSLHCPCCRYRLSIWSRSVSKTESYLDEVLWSRIKLEFPQLVAAKNNGLDSQDMLDELTSLPEDQGDGSQPTSSDGVKIIRDGIICKEPGVIKAELEQILEGHQQDLEKKRLMEEAASADFIRQLQEEEEKQRTTSFNSSLEEDDFLFAKRLQNQLRKEERLLNAATRPLRSSTRIKKPVRRNLAEELEGTEHSQRNLSGSSTDNSFLSAHHSPLDKTSTSQLVTKRKNNTIRKKKPPCTVTSENVMDSSSEIFRDTKSLETIGKADETVETPSKPSLTFAELFNEVYKSMGLSNNDNNLLTNQSPSGCQEVSALNELASYPLSAWFGDYGSLSDQEMADILSSSPVPPTPPHDHFEDLSIDPILNDSVSLSVAEDSGEIILDEDYFEYLQLEAEVIQARCQKHNQEAQDRAFAQSLNSRLRLGLPSPTGRPQDTYRLRRSLPSRTESEEQTDAVEDGDNVEEIPCT